MRTVLMATRTGTLFLYPPLFRSQLLGCDPVGEGHPGPLGRVVHVGGDAVELVEALLHPRGARRAGHAADHEVDALVVLGRDGRVAHQGAPWPPSAPWPSASVSVGGASCPAGSSPISSRPPALPTAAPTPNMPAHLSPQAPSLTPGTTPPPVSSPPP